MSDYTPTTEEVRLAYWNGRKFSLENHDINNIAEFDRWLAEVKSQAWEEGYDEGYVDGSCDRERADNPYRQGEEQ